VAEEEIVEAMNDLAKSGLYVEATSASAAAALSGLLRRGVIRPEETTVVVKRSDWPCLKPPRPSSTLLDKEPDALPKYGDLDLLLGAAKEAAQHASLAVEGRNTDFDDLTQEDRRNADDYYACVLDGLKRAARGSQ
jgi:hypothetical protein